PSLWAREDMKSRSRCVNRDVAHALVRAGSRLVSTLVSRPANARRGSLARGTFSLQLLVLLVPVFFGLMGFAVDLGRLYLIRGELNQVASAMAMASASKLLGTAGATDAATNAANQLLDDGTGHGARYNFGANLVGDSTGLL